MYRRLIFILMLFLTLPVVAQQRLSGKVTDNEGPVEDAHVVELDKSNRVLNQTYTNASGVYVLPLRLTKTTIKVAKDGYEAVVVQINNQARLNVNLVPHESKNVNLLQTMKGAPAVESTKLIVGHDAKGRDVTQPVRIEQMNDSTFFLCMAIVPQSPTAMYPAGKRLHFVDIMDRRLLTMHCIQDCYPLPGTPDDMDMAIHSPQAESRYSAGSGLSQSTQYHLYPCFRFSKKDMEDFLNRKINQMFRVAIETETGAGYWFLYPTDKFAEELPHLMKKLQK